MYNFITICFLVFALVLSLLIILLVWKTSIFITEKVKKKRVNGRIIWICAKRIFICFVGIFLLKSAATGYLAYSHMQEKDNVLINALEVIMDETDYKVDPYYNKKINTKQSQTYLDDMFNTNIWYEKGQKLIHDYKGQELIDAYVIMLDKCNLSVNPEALLEDLAYFDEDSIRTPLELDEIISAAGSAQNVAIEVYIEEFYSRLKVMLTLESGENVYQIARAANDIVSVHEKNFESIYMQVFFITYSLHFYMESLEYTDVKETRADIYLKCGILVEKLQLLLEDTLDDQQRLHLQLLKNAFFTKAKEEMTERDNLCRKELAYYYGRSLYDTGQMCGINDAEYYLEALRFLQEYIKVGDETEVETCELYISKMNKQF